jgi:eukaryotic-like serine/threonine-protein kinase
MDLEEGLLQHLVPGALVAERYRIERKLGQGAMGAVFAATAPDGKSVALKMFFRILGGKELAQERARFFREASVSRNLKSDHIVRVHEHGFDPETGMPFLAMDLLDGEDLESAIARVGPLDPALAVAVALQACSALQLAHRAGVIHRDIKPQNIFLHAMSDTVVAKVCDFGIAKVLDQDSLTATGSVLGSPLYMAPEQFANSKDVDERTDLWSLGMTLYHALAGRAAFQDLQSLAKLVVAVTGGDVPPLRSFAPWVPPDLEAAVHGTLISSRSARCASVRELAAVLESAVPRIPPLTKQAFRPMAAEARQPVANERTLPTAWSAVMSQSSVNIEDDPLVGQLLSDRYRLVRVLGRGGMGAVYEATTPNGETFAVKVIRPDLSDRKGKDALRRFVREAKASQGIDSPYVAQIVDAGADEARGVPYLVMELLRGRDLGALIKDLGPLDPESILPAIVQACDGLTAAHARGIVHRDIKPANIFLHETPGGDVVAKVCDFGVAKQIVQVEEGTELTRTGGVLGSPMYMSPEQAQNAKNVDHRSDVWSLGISLYEALTGTKAWEGSTMGELILAICTRELQPLLEVAPWVRPELAAAMHKATQRDPALRFATTAEFRAALAPLCASTVMKVGAIQGVSPERRRTALAARSTSQVSRYLDSNSASTPTASSSATVPRSRTGMVVGGVAATVVATVIVTLLAVRHAPQGTAQAAPVGSPAPVATAMPSLTPMPSGAAATSVATALSTGVSPSSGAQAPAPRLPGAPPIGGGVRKPVAVPTIAATTSDPSRPPVAATSPPTAPSFKTNW